MQRFRRLIKENPAYFQGTLLGLTAVVPAFFVGGQMNVGLALFFALFIFTLLSFGKAERASIPFWAFLGASALAVWLILHTAFHSVTLYHSISLGLPMLAGLILFIGVGSTKVGEKHFTAFAATLAAGGSLLALIGFVLYFTSFGFPDVRFGSMFFQHNMYAGFISVPLLASLAFALRGESRARWLFFVAFLLMASSLMLTFSRGGFIAVAVGVIVFWAVGYLADRDVKAAAKTAGITLLALALSGVLAFVATSVKDVQSAVLQEEISSPYAKEAPERGESGLQARFAYWGQALELARERPLLGFGWGSFEQESRRVQDDLRFYSIDPHSIFMRFLAETGVIGLAIFLFFLLGVLWPIFKSAWRGESSGTAGSNAERLLKTASIGGLAAMVVHNAGDADFHFPASIALFMATAGLLVSAARGHAGRVMRVNERGARAIALSGSIATILAVFLVAGDVFYKEAEIALSRDDKAGFYSFYEVSAAVNPLNPPLHIKAARVAIEDGEYERAGAFLDRAALASPRDQKLIILRGDIARETDDLQAAVEWYYLARTLAPYRDLEASVKLVPTLDRLGRPEEALGVAVESMRRFPPDKMDSYLWANDEKPFIRLRRGIMRHYVETNG